MPYDPETHHRRSIRLRGYDYTQAGAYFVTICTQDREHLFGEVVEGQMRLNDTGRMVQDVWNDLPKHYPGGRDRRIRRHAEPYSWRHHLGRGRPLCLPRFGATTGYWATTGGCPYVVVAGCGAPVQNHDDKTVRRWRGTMRLEAISGPPLATQLLRTHHPQRRRPQGNPQIHRVQPSAVASGSRECACHRHRPIGDRMVRLTKSTNPTGGRWTRWCLTRWA